MSEEEIIINPDVKAEEKIDINESFAYYKDILSFMGADVPIEALCLPQGIITILRREGIRRVYDLFNRNLGEIKGLGPAREELLTSRLHEFISVCI